MTIIRTINGVETEITLTDRELWDANEEKQYIFDRKDIENYFEDWEDEDFIKNYGKTRAEVEPLMENMACLYRKYMDNCDHYIYERDEAIADVLSGGR